MPDPTPDWADLISQWKAELLPAPVIGDAQFKAVEAAITDLGQIAKINPGFDAHLRELIRLRDTISPKVARFIERS